MKMKKGREWKKKGKENEESGGTKIEWWDGRDQGMRI